MNIFEIDVHSKKPDFLSKNFFGMGCFWGAEKRFWNLKGLYTTVVGYAGGHTLIQLIKKYVLDQQDMLKWFK